MAFDSDGRLWVATAAYDDAGTDAVYVVDEPGSTPVEVITDAHTPLGLLWVGETLFVAASGGVDAYSGFDGADFGGTGFAEHHSIVDLPDDVGEVNGLAMSCERPHQPRRVSAVRLVHADLEGLGCSAFVPARRQRPASRRERHPSSGRARLLPRHRPPLRDDEPARRPRRRDAGRLVVDRRGRTGLGLPRLLRAGRRCVQQRAPARSRSSTPTRP